jgi:type 1 glutamine amidotransferase
MNRIRLFFCLSLLFALAVGSSPAQSAKKIVLVAGTPAAGPGEHEFNAGVLLLKKCLDTVPGIQAIAFTNGWPSASDAFDGAAAIVLYMTGGTNHLAIQPAHMAQLQTAMQRGVGLACFHITVDVPVTNGGPQFLNWLGGYCASYWSVKAFWVADFTNLPVHPITRGVKPFTLRDEWYYHMRFADSGVTPILSAIPPESTRQRTGEFSGNAAARADGDKPQTVAWAYERPDGGRAFGLTGAHYHKNWGDDNFRKLVLNGLLWIAKVEVPPDGVQSTVTSADLGANLDPKPAR